MGVESFFGAAFIKTAIKPADYPVIKDGSGNVLPDVAAVGRSNVGKSTLLNHLFHRKNLVRTSGSPGKTQALQFFTIDEGIVFVDLPGYGFAKVPLSVRKQWGPMMQSYFNGRESLALILFLFDVRRKPNDEDFQMISWIRATKMPMIFVLTKIDKVKRNERLAKKSGIMEQFSLSKEDIVEYSALKNRGRNELTALIRKKINVKII